MMDANGVFVGEVCHIEGAEPGGERFNPAMTNEERRAFSNLMLMCHDHHVITNDVTEYTVARLQQIKADHEKRFSRPDRAMLEQFKDWTTTDQLMDAKNLKRMDHVLGWGLNEDSLRESVKELNEHLARLRRVPANVRQFIGSVAARMHRMRDTRAVKIGDLHGSSILANDVRDALRISESAIVELMQQAHSYQLGYLDVDEDPLMGGTQTMIQLFDFRSGWPFYVDLAEFCEVTQTSIDVFTVDLEFGRLDE